MRRLICIRRLVMEFQQCPPNNAQARRKKALTNKPMSEFERNLTAPGSSHLILWLTVLFTATAIFWASRAEIDEVTRGEGKVIPSGQIQVIQNLEGGIVSELLVKEGSQVEKDQVLLRIDDTRFSSSYRENQVRMLSLQAKIRRLAAESENRPFSLPASVNTAEAAIWHNEQRLYQSRQEEQENTAEIFRQQLEQRRHELKELQVRNAQARESYTLAKKELAITRPLVKQGVMSEVELLRLQRQLSDLKGELDGGQNALPRAQAALAETRNKLKEVDLAFRTRAETELNEARGELARLQESAAALEDRVSRTAVRSPVKGTVKQLKINTVGGVIQPGMDLLEIVPSEDTLLVEARIRPADIAFLHPGQNAMVKFTAYDFAIFGGLKATLEHISADSLLNRQDEAFYRIRLRTERNYLARDSNKLPIIPGMIVTVDILTGRKTVLDYLLKPLNRVKERALRER